MIHSGGKPRILVVDDELNIRELLSASLRFAGFDVTSASDGQEAVDHARTHRPDLVLLDVMLPDTDGFSLITCLREGPCPAGLPAIFVTAKASTEDKVKGLTSGADDYVTKPFSVEELITRIKVILRRSARERDGRLVIADLELDPLGYQVLRGGIPVLLSPTEFRLLEYLMTNVGRVLSRRQILNHVWANDLVDDNIVESYISFLRRKMDRRDPGSLKLIHTVRGLGYVLRRPTGR